MLNITQITSLQNQIFSEWIANVCTSGDGITKTADKILDFNGIESAVDRVIVKRAVRARIRELVDLCFC